MSEAEDSQGVVDLASYRQKLGDARQAQQIQQSLRRLSTLPLEEIADTAVAASIAHLKKEGFDTLADGFTLDMDVIRYLMKGCLEATYTLETDNTLMMDANRINIGHMKESEENGSG